jgi:hypothetical protein
VVLLFCFILVYFYETHKVLVGLHQGVSSLAFSFKILFSFYFYNMHEVLVGLPQGVRGFAILFYFILFYFSLFLQHAPGARRAPPRGLAI